MATIMTPESPATDPRPAGDLRLSTIRANLMPDEVIIARRTEALRRQVMLALAIVLGLIIAWYVFSWWQTHQSNGDLDDANHKSIALTNQQHQYGALVAAQNQTTTTQGELVKLMVGDVQWKSMLGSLRSVGPHGITVTNVNAQITTGAAAPTTANSTTLTGPSVLNESGKQQIGTILITGTAPDNKTIAAYVDSLSTIKGLTAPYLTGVTNNTSTAGGKLVFTINVLMTTDAFGGRFSVATLGGK